MNPGPAPAATARDHLARAAAAVPGRVALRADGQVLTYREYAGAAGSLGAILRPLLQGDDGRDGVALLLPNSAELNVAVFGAWAAGAKAILLNAGYPERELLPLLRDAAPAAIVTSPALADAIRRVAEACGVPHVIVLGAGGEVALQELAAVDGVLDAVGLLPAQPAILLYTGGTTGIAKGVEHSHASLLSMVANMGVAWPTRFAAETWLGVAPVFHIYGFLMGLMNPAAAAAELLIVTRFKPEPVIEMLARERVTVFGGGPGALYNGLLAAANLDQSDLSALRVCPGGGAPFAPVLLQRWEQRIGCAIHEAYGMTEIAPITGNYLAVRKPGSVGVALPGIEVGIVDLAGGVRPLPAGERGEVRVRGAYGFAGYRNRPDDTAAALRDGWIHTGDVGYLDDDGYLFLVDRTKDMVLVGGFNVYPREVEEALSRHADVQEAAVIGVADARKGEAVVAFVVPRPGSSLDGPEPLRRHCAEYLANYKQPSRFELVAAIPKTPANKTDRRALRQRLAEET